MKPRIGVTMNLRTKDDGAEEAVLDSRYLDYVAAGGAVPFPIMPGVDAASADVVLDGLGGVLFTGGDDLDPRHWGQAWHEKAIALHPRREKSELMLYEMVRQRGLAIMGICLGIQLINVAHGGTLHQHVPDIGSDVTHQAESHRAAHALKLSPDTRLREWLGTDEVMVNSYHHQSVNRVGEGLVASGRAADGLVESVERPGYPFLLGVQWHPERDMTDVVSEVMVSRFVAAAAVLQLHSRR